ncbi:hypothetical protein FAZ69_29095 [Trinickia terrae]|uniref:Uncharacterized protein n=1 Tax=Trinickia terrae TaxID=2571161 RepID=A0A4U1HJZ7_9BURK|nr:hypothetical protein FAZ69_29095 [Trinickia terrae]
MSTGRFCDALCYGETLDRETAGVATECVADNAHSGLAFSRRRACHFQREGGRMDLAMAMGLALFGMFAGSTVVFFYKLAR